ncbi:MAG: hypothetical protein EBY34_06170 [Alphaproteobacteria bacterium]|nr:hypothetical protein [Alphaproteobacteria bacterium]NDG37293.1 hypothetical protein [Alphaproteobacteria bacterium]
MTDQRNANHPNSKSAVSANPILQPQCPSCGRPENIVWVHGHGQCAHCRMNVMPCCDGETCDAP